ncbi:MAG TPA: rhomboid family intramembrane serine protease [Verrucomicrobiae bacterium]|nr:rhomboid family intramembrane serine protease [Verrucomicrobiae bacterium]
MLEDRDYMRQPDYGQQRISLTVALLIVNVIIFIIECVTCGYPPIFGENNYFALSLNGIKHGYLWQLLTFQFMHAGLLHILFNSWTIYVFGREIEARLGAKKFLIIYFCGGIIGGLLEMIGAFFWPSHFGTSVVGASAGGMALIASFAVFYAEEPLTIFLYFFPITMRAKYFAWGLGCLSVLCILFPSSIFTMLFGGNVANGAHLGGILTGLFLARQFSRGDWHWPQWKFPSRREKPREFAAAGKDKKSFWPTTEDLSDDEFLKNEVDPILDKISAHGIQSLTARERQILEKARSKMTKQ